MASLQSHTCSGTSVARRRRRRRDHGAAIQRLATGVLMTSLTGAVVVTRSLPPAPRAGRSISPLLGQLGELEELIHSARASATDVHRESQARAGRIASILAEVDLVASATSQRSARQVDDGVCPAGAGPARVYLSTTSTYAAGGLGSVSIGFTGNGGTQHFTFASGTPQASIISAINTFTEALGVSAAQSVLNTDRIVVASTQTGPDAFVRVEQLSNPDLIFSEPVGGQPLDDLKDYGSNPIELWATGRP